MSGNGRRYRHGGGHLAKGSPVPRGGRARDRKRRRPRILRALGRARALEITTARQASACGPPPSSCAACEFQESAWGPAAQPRGWGGKGLAAGTEQGRAWAGQETCTTGLDEGLARARATTRAGQPPRSCRCPTRKWSRLGDLRRRLCARAWGNRTRDTCTCSARGPDHRGGHEH